MRQAVGPDLRLNYEPMRAIWKWVIGVLVFLFVAATAGTWYLSRHWKPLLDQQIREAVVQSSDSLYRVSYDDLDLNLLTGNLLLSNFELVPDTAVYQRLKLAQTAPDNTYHIRVARLRVRHFHPWQAVMGRRLQIDELFFDQPSVHIRNEYQAYNDTVSVHESKTLYQRISNVLKSVSIGDVLFNNIDFQFTKITDTVAQGTTLKNINLRIRDILVDSLSQYDSTRFYHTKSIDLAMPGTRYHTADSLYHFGFDHVHVRNSGASNEVTVAGFNVAPRVNRSTFYPTVGYAKAMINLSFDTIKIQDIDMRQFARSQRVHARAMHVPGGQVSVFNDIRYGRLQSSQIGKAPHQQLMRLGPNFRIDSLLLDSVKITYAEIGENTGKEGEITFDRTSGTLYNIANDSLSLLRNKEMKWAVTPYLMDAGKLSVVFSFDMLATNGAYSYNGQLGPMDGRRLNKLLRPLLNIEIESANIQGLRFGVNATDTHASGSLRFNYTDLKANLLTEEDEDGNQSTRGLVSFLANRFILNDSNPDANGEFHPGPVNFARPPAYTFWRYTWKSLLDGIKPSVGLSAEREATLQRRTESTKNTVERTGNFFRNLFRKKDEEKNDN